MRYMLDKELEALKRIRQETCPATYNPDFDKEECCDVIEQALTELQAIKEAKPSEALEKELNLLQQQKNNLLHKQARAKTDNEIKYWQFRIDKFNEKISDFTTIKATLLKAQQDNTTLKLAVDFANEVGEKLHLTDMDEMLERIEKLEKELDKHKKVLEIIAFKKVDIQRLLFMGTCEDYNAWVGITYDRELTEEEFELLKEMLE